MMTKHVLFVPNRTETRGAGSQLPQVSKHFARPSVTVLTFQNYLYQLTERGARSCDSCTHSGHRVRGYHQGPRIEKEKYPEGLQTPQSPTPLGGVRTKEALGHPAFPCVA